MAAVDIGQQGQVVASEIATRRATPDDADELARLRGVMLLALDISTGSGGTHGDPHADHADPHADHAGVHAGAGAAADWHQACAAELRRRLAEPADAVAYVVDRPGEPGRLAASGIGLVRHGLPAPSRFDTRSGYVLSVCTDPEFRGRGFATAIMTSLLGWFTAAGIVKVNLHASQFGVEIYRRLGFTEPRYPELTWRLPPS